jgi:uncharacterized membrane protein
MAGIETQRDAAVLKNVQTIADLEAQAASRLTGVDRLSARISNFAGSTKFILSHAAWFGGWVALNRFSSRPLDPYPFTFLTFLVSLEAIFLSSFVLISQNHMERQAHRRAALDLQINLLAEREMTRVLNGVIAIAEHLKIAGVCDDAESRQLARETDIATIAAAVDLASEGAAEQA